MHYESPPRIGLQKHKYNFEKIHWHGKKSWDRNPTFYKCTMRVLHELDYKNTSTNLRKYTGMEKMLRQKPSILQILKDKYTSFENKKYRNISYLIRKRSCSSWLCPPHPTWASSIAHVAEHWTSGKIHENEIDLYILPPFLA